MMNEVEIIFVFCNIINTYVIFRLMHLFVGERKYSRNIEILSYFTYYIISAGCFYLIHIPIVMLIGNLILFFAISFNYSATGKERILAVISIYSILFIIEMLVAAITGYIHFPMDSQVEYTSVMGLVINQILGLVVVNFLRVRKKQKIVSIPAVYWFCIIIIPLFSLYFLVTILDIGNLNKVNTIILISFLLIINFSILFLYDFILNIMSERTSNLLLEQQNKYYARQIDIMEAAMKLNNFIQHDLNNHLIAVESYLRIQDTSSALEYINKMKKYNGEAEEIYSKTGNSVIDSILNLKLHEATINDIHVSVKVQIPEQLEIDSFDLTVILCNLLDNAIEATQKLNSEKKINISLIYDRRRLILSVENTYIGKIKMNKGQLFTSKNDEYSHGVGLKNVGMVVEKYKGTFDISYDNIWFKIYVMLYV